MMLHRRPAILVVLGAALAALTLSCAGSPETANRKEQAEAIRNLGEAYLTERKYREALAELLKVEEMTPDDPILQNDLGLAYQGLKRYDLAVARFRRALSLKSDYIVALNNLGTAYLAQNDLDAAIECFTEASSSLLYATPHYPLHNLGLAYFRKGELSTAAGYFRQALEAQPDYTPSLWGLGRAYLQMDRPAEAVPLLQKASSQAPEAVEVSFDLAEALRRSGSADRAAAVYRRILASSPDHPLVPRVRAALESLK